MKRRGFFRWVSILLWGFCLAAIALPGAGSAQADSPSILVLTARGPVAPAMREYLNRGLETAQRQGADMLIFQLDTPGGAIDVMSEMIASIRNSPTPVVVYVAPRGAMAASAGTLITLAGHASAMAPQTTIGAASPVGGAGEDLGETMAAKIKNDMKATARTLRQHRSDEAIAFVERAIDNAEAATSQEALEFGVIDFIAVDLDDLLAQMDGFQVQTSTGDITLRTQGAQVTPLPLSLIEQLLNTLANPNIIFLLLAIGVQAILIEISSPGGWLAGFLGIVCLALAVYGMGILPVNWFGLLFLVVAFVLFILELKTPTYGALTAAGVGSLIVGALVLFNSPQVPSFQRVSVPLVIGTSVVVGAMFFLVVLFAIRAQKTPVQMGQESLVGRTGLAQTDLAPTGIVHVAGEDWSAELEDGVESVTRGSRVRVTQLKGLRLVVRKVE
jgi:membrane-bound serine protease (ClpP class)